MDVGIELDVAVGVGSAAKVVCIAAGVAVDSTPTSLPQPATAAASIKITRCFLVMDLLTILIVKEQVKKGKPAPYSCRAIAPSLAKMFALQYNQ